MVRRLLRKEKGHCLPTQTSERMVKVKKIKQEKQRVGEIFGERKREETMIKKKR